MASHRKIPRAGLWSNISPETLCNIGKRLESKIDVSRCRSVCRNWRASINPKPNPSYLSPFLPRKITNSSLPFSNRPNETLILFARTVFLVKPISSSNGSSSWILTVEEVVPGKLRILYPLSKDPVTNLPSNFPKYLNLLDFRLVEIAKSYGFKYASNWNDVNDVNVVLCSDSTAMVLYGEGTLIGVRLRNGNWGFVRDSLVAKFSDVINFKGIVCAVDFKGNLHSVDHKKMKVNKTVTVKLPGTNKWNRKRLVANEGKLWLVVWSCNDDDGDKNSMVEKNQFKVFRVGELHKELVMETSLRGWSLFVSLHWCFIVCAQDLKIREYLFQGERAVNPFSYKPRYSYFMDELKWYEMKGDYLVFSQNCFESSAVPLLNSVQLFEEASVNLPISVFYFQSLESLDRDRTSSLGGIIGGVLWPPPTWFLPDVYTSSGDDEENEGSDSWVIDVSSDIKGELCLNCPIASESSSMSSTVQEIAQEEFPCQNVSSWSDLPQELLLAIAQRVETLSDIIQFRAVCKTWRQSASFSSLPQRNLLSPILPYKISTLSHCFLSEAEEIPGESMIIVESSVFLLRSTVNPELPPWLFTVEELNPGKVYLRKPLSQLAIKNLPENFPKMLQLSQFQVLKICSLYTLRFEDDHRDMFGMGWCTFNSKVVLLVNSDHITTPAIHDYFVIVLYGDGDLAAMRLGNEEHSHLRSISGTRKFDDIVNFKGQIYAIDRKGRAYRMHSGQFVLESVVNDLIGKGSGAGRRKRLAESCGDLYLVCRSRDCGFRIFKLNEEQKIWVDIEGIGYDKILFVTFDGCVFASAKDFPGWKGNCIVFYRGCFPSYTGSAFFDYNIFKTRKPELDIAVFHLGGGDCGSITSYPTYSNVLWPPPTWLSSNKCSSECVPEDQITSEPISKTRVSPTLQKSQDTPNVHEGEASRG